jgi:protein TonB
MSYKSLLFCPDEKAARLVTQVLSELDFTVELAAETYPTVKKLTEEHFDALVVDCQNEQDASLLFKAARNSAENHSSLSVAVVEGQTGVAKAFRIGANLVLTKPINVEQSKSTLRVARGLLKKNQAKPVAVSGPEISTPLVLTAAADNLIPATQKPGVAAAASFSSPSPMMSTGPASSFSALEVEREAAPATEAADAAVLESLPQLPSKLLGLTSSPVSAPKPFAAGATSGGAAAAPAIEKIEKPVELHSLGSAPLVTNEPIVKDPDAPSAFEMQAAVPTFSSLDSRASEGGGKGFLKVAVVLLLLAGGGFVGWQKLHLSQYLHRDSAPAETNSDSAAPQIQTPSAPPVQNTAPEAQPVTAQPGASSPASDEAPAPEQFSVNMGKTKPAPAPEDVEVQEMPISRDVKITVTPKPQPLVVKSDASKSTHKLPQPAAPAITLPGSGSDAAIANLVTTEVPLPQPAPATVRISQGVSQGLLMKKVAPVYPSMALQLRREGIVQLLATVSKDGKITNIKVLSGDSMLVRSATDAVRQWQYRPYLLNGQPLEVETQIAISFKLPK